MTDKKISQRNAKSKVGKIKLASKKERTSSSRQWLIRQLNDPFVQQAKKEGYRSRAAFKLLGIDNKFKLLKPGMTVIDLGSAPGGWTQVAVNKVITSQKKGFVIAIDLQEMISIPEATFIQGDFLEEETQIQLQNLLPNKVDVILSDMAAPACGMTDVDHIRIMALVEMVYEFCLVNLKPGGSMVAKVLRGGTENTLLQQLKKSFTKISHFKPEASRQDSSEMYLVAIGFRALKNEE